MGFLADPVGSVSDTVSHVGQVISESPIAQAAIAVGGAMVGIPPSVTAGLLAANSVGQGQSLEQAALTGGLSYLGGTGVNNYGATGSVFGEGGLTGLLGGTGGGAATGATAAEQGAVNALIAQGYSPSAAWEVVNAGGAGVASTVGAGAASTAGLLSGISGGALKTGLGLAGSYLNANAAQDAASTQAQAQIRAAQIAADAAKFRPVGVTTNFGSSQFNYDANGNLVQAGYNLSPQLQAQQNQIMGATGGLLNQYTGAQAATAGMDTAAQRAMTLGNQYLATDPQAQAAKYLADQQGLLAPGRAQDFATLQAQNAAQGRSGFAMGGGVNGQMAANPEMQAYWNARMQQDAQLAANATQGGMDYAKFGLGTVGSGGDMLSGMYKTQAGAAQPYQTALGVAQGIEGMGQQAMGMGTAMGAKTSTASAQAGMLLGQGYGAAANTIGAQAAQAGSPWGNLLQGGADMMRQYGQPQGYQYDPGKYRVVPL